MILVWRMRCARADDFPQSAASELLYAESVTWFRRELFLHSKQEARDAQLDG